MSALGGGHGHLGAEDLLEDAGNSIGVQHQLTVHVAQRFLHDQPPVLVPVGPKRSVRICDGGRPSRTSVFAADSTSSVGPQINTCGTCRRGLMISFNIASSMRRE